MRRLAILASAVLVLVGCRGGSGDGSPEASGTTTAETTARPTTTKEPGPPEAWPKSGSSPLRISGDGRYFGYIRSGRASERTIGFDVAQFFYGASKQEAAEEDGVVQPGEPVSNDHYERNPEQDVEQLRLASGASITAAWPASFLMRYATRDAYAKCEKGAGPMPCLHVPLSRKTFFRALRDLSADHGIPMWVTIREGLVQRADEQYFP